MYTHTELEFCVYTYHPLVLNDGWSTRAGFLREYGEGTEWPEGMDEKKMFGTGQYCLFP